MYNYNTNQEVTDHDVRTVVFDVEGKGEGERKERERERKNVYLETSDAIVTPCSMFCFCCYVVVFLVFSISVSME